MPPAMEPQAQLFYNVLEAIFDYADANLEPKDFGLMTFQKLKTMIEKANMPDLLAGLHILEPTISPNSNPHIERIHDSVQNYSCFGCSRTIQNSGMSDIYAST